MDEPAYQKDNAREIARWIRDGLTIERLDVDAVRTYLHSCTCPKPPKATDQMTMEVTGRAQ
jgi:hypothetical protein